MANKKGAELSLNFIIIAAIVLIVLIVAILFFTGGAQKLFSQQKQVEQMSQQEYNLALSVCKSACMAKSQAAYDKPEFTEGLVKAGYSTCESLVELESFQEECQKSCQRRATQSDDTQAKACESLNREDCNKNSNNCEWKL